MSEQDFVMAWLLAGKSGSGIGVPWRDSTIDMQLREAREVYKQIMETVNETHSRTTD